MEISYNIVNWCKLDNPSGIVPAKWLADKSLGMVETRW